MNEFLHEFFITNGFVFELLLAVAFFVWDKEQRDYFLLRVTCVVATMLCLSILWDLLPVNNASTRILRYILLFSVCTYGVSFCYRMKVNQALFLSTAAGAIQHLTYKLADTSDFLIYVIWEPNPWMHEYAYSIFLLPYFAICYFLFARRLNRLSVDNIDNGSIMMMLVGMLLSVNLFQNLFDEYNADINPSLYSVYNMYAIVNCLFLLSLLFEIANREKVEQSNIILKHLLHKQKEQMQASKETINLINVKCHDLKKQIATLGNRIPQEEIDELGHIISIYDKVARTGNEALDILLAEKALLCEERSIRFDYIADGASLSFMKPSDIYALFGNAVDNALEAVYKIEDTQHRYISMKIRIEKEMLMIHIENPFIGTLTFVDGLPETTKNDKRYHGFGMKSIQMIVEKYNGYLAVNADKGLFTLNILLPLNQGTAF